MSRPTHPEPVKIVSSIFSGDTDMLHAAVNALSEEWGAIDYISAVSPFAYTDYYETELGSSLVRRFVSFETLVPPETLPDMKLFTNKIEEVYTCNDDRLVNIDPGYLSQAHLILATGKAYTHRPYLRDGIYADLTLIFTNHSFRRLEWTYPDYAHQETIAMFNNIRERYMIQLVRERKHPIR